MNDPYQVLGISPNATDDEVKKAYKELSRKYHPDAYVNNPLANLAEDKFKEVQEAYTQIMNSRAGGGSGYSQGYSGGYGSGQQGYSNSGYNSGSRDTIMGSITGRVTRIMVQIMGVILMGIMVLEGVGQETSVVTYGVQIRFANVWEGICAVAFKVKRSCIWRHYDGTCSNTYNT